MLSFLRQYAKDVVYSQNGEEGLLHECLRRMEISAGHCVEIGANDGLYCSNTALLLRSLGAWTGLMVEFDYDLYGRCKANYADYENVRVTCAGVNESNVNAFVRDDCVVFSTDTDGSDFSIFRGMKAKPAIVIVEIDSSIPPGDRRFNSDGAPGYTPMLELGIEKGYFLLAHCGNMFFVAEEYHDLFPEVSADPVRSPELFFNPAWLDK